MVEFSNLHTGSRTMWDNLESLLHKIEKKRGAYFSITINFYFEINSIHKKWITRF